MSVSRIAIQGGYVVDPANGIDRIADVHLAEGRIVSVGSPLKGFPADEVIDATGLVVVPGFVDLSVRLREPGYEQKATIVSETLAAAAAGVTTLCCQPDTSPVVDTPAMVKLIQERAETVGACRVLPIGALTRGLGGKDLSEMRALKGAGCLAVGNAGAPLASSLVFRRALEYAASHDLLIVLRPEDPGLRGQGCAHEGAVSSRLGLPAIPVSAETVAVAKALALIEQAGARAHFGQLSSARAVEMIAEARQRGLAVTADVAIHHTDLTETAVDGFEPNAHVSPPFRTEADRAGLIGGLSAGILTAISSDHQPHDLDAKQDAFPSTQPGIASLETLLPLGLRMVDSGRLGLRALVASLTIGPASVLGLTGAGSLSSGVAADICLFDPKRSWRVDETTWRSRGRNTPYWGSELQGRVVRTLVSGRTVFVL
jgi:dihydroorotase